MSPAVRPGEAATLAGVAAHNLLAVRVPATRANLPWIRQLLVAFATLHGAGEATRAAIALAASEAVTNAILHGHGDDPSGVVDVVADVRGDAVEIVIADEGAGMRAGVASDGLGLGLGLIAKSSARFTLRDRQPHGTEVWMRFELP
jgi:anti-sigma regulatory factor (Ser/Thr protein kinase)